jgi:hypothetical protein
MSNENNEQQDKQVNIIIKDIELQKHSMEIPPMPKIKPQEPPKDQKND